MDVGPDGLEVFMVTEENQEAGMESFCLCKEKLGMQLFGVRGSA